MRGFTVHMNLAFPCLEYNPSHPGNLEPAATTRTQNMYPAVGGPWRRPLAMVSPAADVKGKRASLHPTPEPERGAHPRPIPQAEFSACRASGRPSIAA